MLHLLNLIAIDSPLMGNFNASFCEYNHFSPPSHPDIQVSVAFLARFEKWLAIASFLGLGKSDWPKVLR